jgi:hypothetical protein
VSGRDNAETMLTELKKKLPGAADQARLDEALQRLRGVGLRK